MMRIKAILYPNLLQVGPSVLLYAVENLFLTERDWSQESFHGKNTGGVIWFLLRCIFLVPSFKNTASKFPEIFFVQCYKNESTIHIYFQKPFKCTAFIFHAMHSLIN